MINPFTKEQDDSDWVDYSASLFVSRGVSLDIRLAKSREQGDAYMSVSVNRGEGPETICDCQEVSQALFAELTGHKEKA